jgi:hypothetical protein
MVGDGEEGEEGEAEMDEDCSDEESSENIGPDGIAKQPSEKKNNSTPNVLSR